MSDLGFCASLLIGFVFWVINLVCIVQTRKVTKQELAAAAEYKSRAIKHCINARALDVCTPEFHDARNLDPSLTWQEFKAVHFNDYLIEAKAWVGANSEQ